jgi:hypothetical protein
MHEDDVDRHAMEPGRELRLPAKIPQAPVNLEENFLDDVFELGARPDHAENEARHLGTVSKEELSESLAIPPLAARDHFVWFEHSVEANASARPMLEQKAGDCRVHSCFGCGHGGLHSKP